MSMLTLYIVSAAVAGALVILSILGADHGVEHEVHFEHEGHETGESQGHWIPFFSLRFYTYFFAGFGTTGLLITLLTATAPAFTLALAIAVGLFAGFSVSILVRLLRKTETTSGSGEKDVLGLEAKVLVTIRGAEPGRIRCSVKGDAIDFLAVCDDADPIEVGATVIVIAMEDGRALVMPRTALFGDDSTRVRTH
ncbi:MAG: NfeD family protein [Fimbriimonadales bacterium]